MAQQGRPPQEAGQIKTMKCPPFRGFSEVIQEQKKKKENNGNPRTTWRALPQPAIKESEQEHEERIKQADEEQPPPEHYDVVAHAIMSSNQPALGKLQRAAASVIAGARAQKHGQPQE